MKKCPTCGKTFDDNLRFCQVDGTPLVEDVPAAAAPPEPASAPPAPEPVAEAPFDPYATIVGVPKSAIPSAESLGEPLDVSSSGTVSIEPLVPAGEAGPSSSADAGPVAGESVSSIPVAPPDDILDLPGSDPLKTMFVSDAEMNEVLGTIGQGADTPAEEIRADEAQVEAPAGDTDFGSIAPPPSPFSEPSTPEETPVPAPPSFLDGPSSPASEARTQVQMEPPFQPEPQAPEPSFQPEPPPYQDEAPTVFQSQPAPPQFSDPAPAPIQNQDWNPPPAPNPDWQNQQIGSTTPFQPPPAGAGGQNKTLAIISLVLGILSMCCYTGILTGIVALILGFIANKKANQDPQNYGGKGLALAGMITGGLFFAIWIVYWIVIIIFYGSIIASGGFK
jgi:hypothetical protein